MYKNFVVLAALGVVFTASSASAQEVEHRANTRGLFVNGHFNGSSARYEEPETTESGGGAGFQLGYGITRNFTLYFGTDASRISFGQSNITDPGNFAIIFEDKYWLKQFEFGGRYNFVSPTRTWIPYVDLAYTLPSGGSDFRIFPDDDNDPNTPPTDDDGVAGEDNAISGEFELKEGGAFTFGGGVSYFFSQKLALDVNVKYSAVKFDALKLSAADFSETVDEETKFGLTRINFGLSWYPQLGR